MAGLLAGWRRHRGWAVVAGAHLVLLVGYGAIYSCAAFAAAIGASLGIGRDAASLVLAISSGTAFFVSAISGPLADRIGPRRPAAAGMLLVALGLALAARAQDSGGLFASYGLLVGIGVGLAYVPAIAAVQRWFLARRGLASGLALSGIGVGTALVPVLQAMLSRFGDWRAVFTASAVLAVLAVLVGLAGALLLAAAPEEFGQAAEGAVLRPDQAAAARRQEPDTAGALRSGGFALAYGGILLVAVPVAVPFALLVGSAEDIGLPHQEAVGLLALIGLGTVIGRFALAALADLMGRRRCFLGCCLGVAFCMLVWAAARDGVALRGFALVFGALQGGFVALLPAFIADAFGTRAVAGIIGLLYTSRGFALLAGPPAVAFGIAALRQHALPVALCGLAGVAGAALLAMLRPGRLPVAAVAVISPPATPGMLHFAAAGPAQEAGNGEILAEKTKG